MALQVKYMANPTSIELWADWAQPNRPNLLEWLQRFHSGQIMSFITTPSQTPSLPKVLYGIGMMFLMVEKLRGSQWDEVKELLKEHRLVLAVIDDVWA